ncbi:MAG: hypothetical protein NZ693_07730 [Thermoflexales bacterium]|nr:hypothetical protein [Thermoflexales bacterium]
MNRATVLPPLTRSRARPALRAADFVALGLTAVALAAFGFYLLVYFVYARALFNFPFDYDQGEGFELYDAIRLARGQNIYLDNAVYPFYASNYPPVYRTLLALLVALFGPHLWVGRALTFASSLVIGALIFIAARRQWHQLGAGWVGWVTPVLAALSFFAANYVYHIAPLARAHLPMVMFALAGLVCLERALRVPSPPTPLPAGEGRVRLEENRAWAALGVALLMTAGFTKLQAVDALVAGFGLLLLRRPAWFARAFAACLVFTVGAVLALDALTQGQFWINVVAANVNEYDIALTWQTYGQWARLQAVLIIGGVAYVAWDFARAIRARSFQPITVWSLYFITGSAMGMLTGKWGAGPAYLIAAIAASATCTSGVFARLASALGASRQAWIGAGVAAAFLAQAALNVHLPTTGRFFGTVARTLGVAEASVYPPYAYYDSAGYTQLGHLPVPSDVINGWRLVERLRAVNGPVWSEEATLARLAGKDVVTNPTQLLNLYKNDMLDTAQMLAMIEARAFGAVVFRAMFYPDDVKDAIVRNYYWAEKFEINGFEYWLLLPIPKE